MKAKKQAKKRKAAENVNKLPLSDVGLLTVKEAAALLSKDKPTSPKSVNNYINAGLIPVVSVGQAYLIRASDLEGFTKPKRGRPVVQPPVAPPKGRRPRPRKPGE